MRTAAKNFDPALLHAALADPTRLRLLNLMRGHEVCVCYFVEVLGQSQPKISRHLAYLRRAGIVSARREGKWMHYRIAVDEDSAAFGILRETFNVLAQDRAMQADLARFKRACSARQKSQTLLGAPAPIVCDC